tara:strand:+ start:483 stop:875 length:393 start_codon:yes stop_codon:yes gene_type:complete
MKTVFTNGCFDVLHRGHVELLKFCKRIGDHVVVGLNSDDSIRRLKGEGRPINTLKDRKMMLEELRCVDKVIVFEEDTPYSLIQSLNPDIIVKGGDYTPEQVVGKDLAEVVIFGTIDGYSSTKTIKSFGDR